MLVFLLFFYLYYDLIYCDEVILAKFNESLLHKHSQKLLEVHDLLKDLEQQTKELSILIKEEFENDTRIEEFTYKNITNDLRSKIEGKEQDNKTENLTKASVVEVFRPSPEYDPFDPHLGLSSIVPGFEEPPVIPQLPPDPIDLKSDQGGPPYPRFLLKPMYHGVMPPRFLSKNDSGHIFSNSPNSTRPTSNRLKVVPHAPNFYLQILYKKPQFLNPFLHLNRHELRPFHPEFVPPYFDPNFHNPHFSRPPSSFETSPPESTFSPTKKTKTIDHHAKIWLQEIAPYTRRKRRKKKTIKDQTRPHHERPTVPMSPRITESTNYWFYTETASTVQLFNEDEHGFLEETVTEVDGRPMQIPEDTNENWMTTTARDEPHETIQEQKSSTTLSPDERYQELMKQLGEGYLMVFIIELFRLIAVKDKCEVREVLAPVESIIVRWLESNQLFWIDDPLLAVIEKLTVLTSKADNIDVLRSYSSAMFHTLLQRKQQLTPEVNSIVDVAESFYGDAEGRRLLYSLRQFEEYPNTTKLGNQICEGLIESFLQPFRPPAVTVSRGRLLFSVNRILRQRYPQLLRKYHGGTASVEGPPMTATQTSKIKKKHHRKKRKRKRRLENLKPEYYNLRSKK